jgi:membrane dipeptidase
MLSFGRDYTRPVQETRLREKDTFVVPNNGDTVLSWQEYQRGRVALVFATLFAAPWRTRAGDWDSQVYKTPQEAHRLYHAQLDAYERLFDEHPEKFTPVRSAAELNRLLSEGSSATGLLTLMEGADAVLNPRELEEWWQRGVRVIGPAWVGTRYSGGTREPGSLTAEGRVLLQSMAERGFLLDLSHMAWEAALEALDRYEGALLASHSNPLKMVKNGTSNRFLTDEIIDGIVARDGVIGIVPFNRFLNQNWQNENPRTDCPLEMVAAHLDYICQRAGDARHVGFGTDFDGGFGLQHIPAGLDTIADLHLLIPILQGYGYSAADIDLIFGGNWLSLLRKALP